MRLTLREHHPRWRRATTLAIATALAASTLTPTAVAQDGTTAAEDIITPDDLLDRVTEGTSDSPEPTNRFLITYHPGVQSTTEAKEETVTKALEEIGAKPEANTVRQTASGATVIETEDELSPERADELLKKLEEDESIEYAEIDAVLTIARTPNDTHFDQQWALTGESGIDVLPVWKATRGAGQTIAVIDTGLVPHPDLDANVVGGYDFISTPARSRDGDGRDADPTDEGDWINAGQCGTNRAASSSWHGTHVAGTIAATTDNGLGIAGVAPDSRVVPLRALGPCGGYLSDISDAVIWAAGGTVRDVPANPHVANVINMSLGGPGQCSRTYQRAIDFAVDRGVVVVVAAGNDREDASLVQPANCQGTITVGALDARGARAPYSNYGSTVDVWAPGGDTNQGQGILSTIDSGRTSRQGPGFGSYQGTSMAAPHVAGIAALVKAAHPGMSVQEVTSRITGSMNGHNLVKAPVALGDVALPTPTPVESEKPSETPVESEKPSESPEEPVEVTEPEEPEDTPTEPVAPGELTADSIIDATNRSRAAAGLTALETRPELQSLAQDWAQTMSRRGILEHRPDLHRHATVEYTVSENLLRSRGRNLDADELVAHWMNSPAHRANILDPQRKWIGVGVTQAPDGTLYAVQNLGTPRTEAAEERRPERRPERRYRSIWDFFFNSGWGWWPF